MKEVAHPHEESSLNSIARNRGIIGAVIRTVLRNGEIQKVVSESGNLAIVIPKSGQNEVVAEAALVSPSVANPKPKKS